MTDRPATGGSYVRDPVGRLIRQAGEDAPASPRPKDTPAPGKSGNNPKGGK